MSDASKIAERDEAVKLANSGLGLLIDGEIRQSAEGVTIDIVDPSTNDTVVVVPGAGEKDVDAAVQAAKASMDGDWGRFTAKDRERVLRKLAILVDEHKEQLALLEALDAGKPIGMARAVDVPLAIDNLEYYSGWPTKVYGQTIPAGGPDMLVYTRNEPAGVSGQIIPWNFPIFDATGRIAMSLAAGCPIVLKPAEVTPMTAMYLGKLVLEAGVPKGVVNIVPGYGAAAGKALVEHPDVDVVGFTGSTAVGREIGASAARSLKHVSLELGGKSPIVLFDDCDLEPAVDAALSGIFLNTGQVCSAASRLLVQDGIYDKVVAALSAKAKAMKVGRAFEAGTDMGPVVSRKQYDTVRSFIAVGQQDGEVTAGGVAHDPTGGYLIEPTIVAGLSGNSRLVQEEIFGPVLAVERFSDFEDGMRKANAGRYGLAASVWTNNGSTAQRFAQGIKSGTVWVNCYHMYDIAVPWGGVKDSGIGRERSFDGVANLLSKKTVWSAIR